MGKKVGEIDVGGSVGVIVRCIVGSPVAWTVGKCVGHERGISEGLHDGECVEPLLGRRVGSGESRVGNDETLGSFVGDRVGQSLGA